MHILSGKCADEANVCREFNSESYFSNVDAGMMQDDRAREGGQLAMIGTCSSPAVVLRSIRREQFRGSHVGMCH